MDVIFYEWLVKCDDFFESDLFRYDLVYMFLKFWN